MGAKDTTITFALILIFSIALISFATQFATQNDAAVSLGDDPDIGTYTTSARTDTIAYNTEINGTLTSYEESQIIAGSETLVSGSVFKQKKAGPIGTFFSMIGLVQTKIFGGNNDFTIIFSTITATVLLIGTFFSWKLWKGGNPD